MRAPACCTTFWLLSLGRVVHTIAPMMISTTAKLASMAIMIAKCLMKVRSDGVRCVLTCELRLEGERCPRAPADATYPREYNVPTMPLQIGHALTRVDLI